VTSQESASVGTQGVTDRGSDGRFAAGNTVRAVTGMKSERIRRKRRQTYLAESELELQADLPAPIPRLLARITASAIADLRTFEDEVAKRGGPLKSSGATLGFWAGYDSQRRLVIDLLERCGVAPARGRAALRKKLPDEDSDLYRLAEHRRQLDAAAMAEQRRREGLE
jgi:hypothetical protein